MAFLPRNASEALHCPRTSARLSCFLLEEGVGYDTLTTNATLDEGDSQGRVLLDVQEGKRDLRRGFARNTVWKGSWLRVTLKREVTAPRGLCALWLVAEGFYPNPCLIWRSGYPQFGQERADWGARKRKKIQRKSQKGRKTNEKRKKYNLRKGTRSELDSCRTGSTWEDVVVYVWNMSELVKYVVLFLSNTQ